MAHPEIPTDLPDWARVSTQSTPETFLQALMEAAPGDEPIKSKEELQPLREAVADCIDKLTPEHQYVINGMYSERASWREMGRRMGISNVHAGRIRNAALAELRKHMEEHPVIQEYLNGQA